jgi:tetratricopeptide (TPR) repeat protein
LWIFSSLYTPSHALMLITWVMTGAFAGLAMAYGCVDGIEMFAGENAKAGKFRKISLSIIVLFAVVWGLVYVKKATALVYMGSGLKEIDAQKQNSVKNFDEAEKDFRKAADIDSSDIYWRALSEISRLKVGALVATATSTNDALAKEVNTLLNNGVETSNQAITYDPQNYYNYLTQARILETAAGLGVSKGYENAVLAYGHAISVNPLNPSVYLNLAHLQASAGKYPEALQTIGATLRVKNNYIDAIFLLSQVQAAQGNINDAIVSAKVATEIDPKNPLLFFQYGLLSYNAKNYSDATQELEKAIALQADYANARYFLGLSYARLGKNSEALTQFTELARTNPDNKEITLILGNLQSGKSPFADAQPPITTSPEKRSSLPIKEKQR